MKSKFLSALLLAFVLGFVCQPPQSHAEKEEILPGTMNISGVTVSMVLPIYRELCGVELIVSSEVKRLTTKITIGPTGPLKKEEAVQLIEKSLLEQARVVITKLDDKRVSATYNDALPITPVKPHKVQ